MALQSRCKSLTASCLLHPRFGKISPRAYAHGRSVHSESRPSSGPAAKQFKVTLDGQTLYIEKELANALGWTEDSPTEGVTLRLSGWSPFYFAITQKGTDADRLALGTVESSRNPTVQATLEYLKKSDSE